MQIDNVRIYGLEEAIVASGLPMWEHYDAARFHREIENVAAYRDYENAVGMRNVPQDVSTANNETSGKHIDRAIRLGSCAGGESHDCYLCGVNVQLNVTAERYWWPQLQRYHFVDIVSSTSTMHRLKTFIQKYADAQNAGRIDECERLKKTHFSHRTHPIMLDAFVRVAYLWLNNGGEDLDDIKCDMPEGWLQTARITTNYRQLKLIYSQRHKHRLGEWRNFCDWIIGLPYMSYLLKKKD